MHEEDNELTAMAAIVGILGGLSEESRSRVLRYAMERYQIIEHPRGVLLTTDASAASEPTTAIAFDEFAALFDAANPTSGSMRALVAGYWFQVCQSQADFDGQSINNELKNLGHPSKNITSDLSALMNQNPRLAMQVRKSGRSQQARKTYKLTVEGIRRCRSLFGGEGSEN